MLVNFLFYKQMAKLIKCDYFGILSNRCKIVRQCDENKVNVLDLHNLDLAL